jgi:hypothetical protein
VPPHNCCDRPCLPTPNTAGLYSALFFANYCCCGPCMPPTAAVVAPAFRPLLLWALLSAHYCCGVPCMLLSASYCRADPTKRRLLLRWALHGTEYCCDGPYILHAVDCCCGGPSIFPASAVAPLPFCPFPLWWPLHSNSYCSGAPCILATTAVAALHYAHCCMPATATQIFTHSQASCLHIHASEVHARQVRQLLFV